MSSDNDQQTINFIRSVSTALDCYDPISNEEASSVPEAVAESIFRLEEILSELTQKASSLLKGNDREALRKTLSKAVIFLRCVEYSSRKIVFMEEDDIENLPTGVQERIYELEGLVSRLSLEATAVLFHNGHLPYVALKKGRLS